MSNLGGYQKLTTLAKKVGGPKNLVLINLGVGYGLFRTLEGGVKFAHKSMKKETVTNKIEANEYKVLRDAIDSQGLTFKVGDTIRILETANDVILIEKVGDNNNPYYVSLDFLKSITLFS